MAKKKAAAQTDQARPSGSKTPLPESLRRFVEQQTTRPVADLWKVDPKERRSPYGSCWYRAVACILLSGRVQARNDGGPNMTDVNRVGKEANFNQYLTERVGTFLVAMDAIQVDRRGRYEAGPDLPAFWDHDVERLRTISRQAVLRLARRPSLSLAWRPQAAEDPALIEFLSLFFACFRGRALLEAQAGRVFHEFCLLPQDDLIAAARGQGLGADAVAVAGWRRKLDAKGQEALMAALSTAEWSYYIKHEKTVWWFASPIGLAMLGLEPPPPAPELATVLKAQPDLSVFAGAGLAWETLVPLFRYAAIRRIDEVYEFRLDRKRLAESPADRRPGDELRQALRALEPLPPAVADVLATKSRAGGKFGIRWCGALIHPEDGEVLEAIRAHPKLKGYIEPGAPPGFLLLKGGSNFQNFVRRCRELGFEVEST